MSWLVNGLKSGQTQTLLAKPTKNPEHAPTVLVRDQIVDGKVDISVAGNLFTSYHYGCQWVRPFLHPVVGPYGTQVTRNWPIAKNVRGEHHDHPHHKSIWVAYGECNQVDNWSEDEGHGWQRHRSFQSIVSGPVFGLIAAKNDWCDNNERKQFEEIRRIRVYALPGDERLFDVEVAFRMSEAPVVFRDTKEGGLLAVRVASSMDVRNGGRIQNAYGGTDETETWGHKAPWCDYSGLIDGKHVGIAVMDHESNPRYPTEWHVRDYGLMTANCFAWKYYRPDAKSKGDMLFKKGATRTWRYRIHVHRGDAILGKVAARFMDFVAPPKVECPGTA